MAKVLFITANPKDENQSFSIAAGKAFLETYKKQTQILLLLILHKKLRLTVQHFIIILWINTI